MNTQDSNKDGLENFFHNRLNKYQDEPSEGLWERIQSSMPEKPQKKYTLSRPSLGVVASGVAACLIVTLGLLNWQYKNEIKQMAQDLQMSQNQYTALENRLDEIHQKQTSALNKLIHQGNERPSVNHFNTSPSVIKEKEILTKVVYIPTSAQKQENFTPQPQAQKQNHTHQKTNVTNSLQEEKIDYTQRVASKVLVQKYKPQEVLNLNKINNSSISSKHKNWNFTPNDLEQRNIASQFSQVKRFQNPNIHHNQLAWVAPTRMLASDRQVQLAKLGTGANYPLGANLSVFMGTDNWNVVRPPVPVMNDSPFTQAIGIESGVKYHF